MPGHRWFASILTLLGLSLPALVRAQDGPRIVANERAPLYRSHYIPIVIQTQHTTTVSIAPLKFDHDPKAEVEWTGVECEGSCTVQLPPGEYRVSTLEKGGRAATRTLRLHDPERLRIGPASDLSSNVCLALGVAGSLMVPVGAIFMLSSRDGKLASSPDAVPLENQLTGLGIGAAGAALAITGFVLYAKSLRFELVRSPLSQPTPLPSSSFDFRVGPNSVQLGAAFAL